VFGHFFKVKRRAQLLPKVKKREKRKKRIFINVGKKFKKKENKLKNSLNKSNNHSLNSLTNFITRIKITKILTLRIK
jgi:hypothetical protein